MRRGVALAVVAALVVVAVWTWTASSGRGVEVAVVDRGTVATWVEEVARTRLPRIERIAMPLSGRVLPIGLEAGDVVAEGDVVARLDDADLKTTVAEARARVEGLRAKIVQNDDTRLEVSALAQFDKFLESMDRTVESAGEQRTASEAKLRFSETEFGRIERLFESKAASESQRNAAELLSIESRVDYRKDVLTLDALESVRSAMRIGGESIRQYIAKKELERNVLEQQLAEAQQQLVRAQRDLDRSAVAAKSGGVVLERHVSSERFLSAGDPLVDVGRLEDLEVVAEILSQDVLDVRVGQPVEIHGAAVGCVPLAGEVARIHPQGFTKVSSLGVEQQRVLVVVRFVDSPDARASSGYRLGVDYRVRVRIRTAEKRGVLRVPRSALVRGVRGGWEAFVVRGGRAQRTVLALGLLNDFEAEVVEGVAEGDRVVVAPDSTLASGERVAPEPLEPTEPPDPR